MKIIFSRHRPNDLAHAKRVYNLAHHLNRGSIMIWTVMLGLLLTSVFFFFSMRQRMMLSVQRDTTAMQDAKLFLESYADYLENRCKTPGNCVPDPVTVASDGIAGSVTQKVDLIESAVDFGETQEYALSGSIYVEWNKCSAGVPDSSGDLRVNDVLYPHQIATVCGANEEYDDLIGPISVTSPLPLKILTQNAPFYFRIKSATGAELVDNQWHLELSKDLDYGKKVTTKRTFK